MYILDENIHDGWNLDGLRDHFIGLLTTSGDYKYTVEELENASKQGIADELKQKALSFYEKRENELGGDVLRELERVILLKIVDLKWMDHIDDMDELRKGIGLRAYGQKNPVVEYRYEGFEMFDAMIESIREETIRLLFTIQINNNQEAPKRERVMQAEPTKGDGSVSGGRRVKNRVGRNDPCPCGSGKKFKNCCGRDLK